MTNKSIRDYINLIENTESSDENPKSVAEGSKEYCDACDRVITKKPHVCPGTHGVAEGTDPKKELMQQIHDAKAQVKLMSKQHGPASQQYKDAIKHQAALVTKMMTTRW